jgi:hypothetical protein
MKDCCHAELVSASDILITPCHGWCPHEPLTALNFRFMRTPTMALRHQKIENQNRDIKNLPRLKRENDLKDTYHDKYP